MRETDTKTYVPVVKAMRVWLECSVNTKIKDEAVFSSFFSFIMGLDV